jgi:hypothetical protein
MSNPEGFSSSKGESAGETPRAVNQERGQKTEAQIEAERKAKMEEYKKLDEKYFAIMGEHLPEPKISGGESSSTQSASEAPKSETRSVNTYGAPAPETSSASAAPSVEKAPAPEKSPEKVNEAKNGQKKNSALKNLVRSAAIGAAVLAVAFGVTMATVNNKANTVNPQESSIEYVVDSPIPSTAEFEANYEGIRDGYGETGMWVDANYGKGSNRFADAKMMYEDGGVPGDAREFVKNVGNNEVEAMASYLFGMPDQLLPEEYQGLTSSQMENKLESLSDEEFESIRSYFNEVVDKAVAEDTTLNGVYHNFYIGEKDKDGKYEHDNMELKQCQTSERGTRATKLTWFDGDQEIGSMIVKLGHKEGVTEKDDDSWEGCVQVVFTEDSPKVIIIDSPVIPTPPGETPPPDVTPPPGNPGKNAQNYMRINQEKANEEIKEQTGVETVVHQEEAGEQTAQPVIDKDGNATNVPGSNTEKKAVEEGKKNDQEHEKAVPASETIEKEAEGNEKTNGEQAVKPDSEGQKTANEQTPTAGELPTDPNSQEAKDAFADLGI